MGVMAIEERVLLSRGMRFIVEIKLGRFFINDLMRK